MACRPPMPCLIFFLDIFEFGVGNIFARGIEPFGLRILGRGPVIAPARPFGAENGPQHSDYNIDKY
jgi:hypothetical protein